MQKTIQILAIIAVVLVAVSMILLLVTMPFQSVIALKLYGYPQNFVEALPQFPLLPFLNCFLRAACISLLIISCGSKKCGILLELLVLGGLVIILPAISYIASQLYTVFLGSISSQQAAANSAVTSIAIFCSFPSNLGQALAYVVCGMSIAFKKMSGKTNYEVINEVRK